MVEEPAGGPEEGSNNCWLEEMPLGVGAVKRVVEGLPECRLINGYGPTEATTFSCCHLFEPRRLRWRDRADRETDCEHAGLCAGRQHATDAGGSGMENCISRGWDWREEYLKRAGLTAERFVANPAWTGR